MITQLLFGDIFSIIGDSDKFIHIKIQFDNYECWICKKQYLPIKKSDFLKISNSLKYYTTDLVQVISYNKKLLPIVQGSSLPAYKNGVFEMINQKINFEGNVSSPNKIISKDKIVEDALMYLNAPYLWGGKSPFGIDCSGLTQIVFKINNITIPRDAYQQVQLGEGYSFIEEAEAGDVAFFDNEEGDINHVGILISSNKIIHASGKVRIDSLDHQGIFNKETNSYSHKLRIIKSLI
jgi:hypothetical protein